MQRASCHTAFAISLRLQIDGTAREQQLIDRMTESTLFITGASGYIGGHLAAASTDHFRVSGASRNAESDKRILSVGATPVRCSGIEDPSFAQLNIAEGGMFLHAAAHVHQPKANSPFEARQFERINIAGTEHAARLARRAGAKRFVLVSTIAVYGNSDREKSPLQANSALAPTSHYATSKLASENAARKVLSGTDVALTIVRIPMVYGRKSPGNFTSLCAAIDKHLPLPIGNATKQRSFLYIENLVSALLQILRSEKALPETLLLADEQTTSAAELARALIRLRQSNSVILRVPKWLVRSALRISARQSLYHSLFGELTIDCSQVKSALDWQPPFALDDALVRSCHRSE